MDRFFECARLRALSRPAACGGRDGELMSEQAI